ncbi:ADP-ribose pyrophosphatase YjhB, NUDIX family [Hathewaya proteolytica DSM 3090]|uniref:ADP-ribose pyrophosphatase YjhB, NUDIX family n=1 Tax=Hathewaya proteolytica DSM 3090 TaxID=1121331 RepID=A0A1M6MVZ1_9CLOT|nr:NUDIX hydrolase [Hathewaya proteolytica]SHJ87602.1 ADP-ribose pyrophosphatase YjhB, NUDIX family [Hathewaya proteolytica DSM 3090]
MNKQDILFKNEDGVFSYRIGGILIHGGKVLLQQCNGEKDYAIPGGHVSFGETSKDTIVREFKEETGFDVNPERLLWIGEVFFPWDTKPCHQICMYFLVTLCDETQIQSDSSFFGVDELERQRINLKFSWIPLTDLKYIKLYPLGTKEKLMNLSDNVEHFVYIEN